MRWVWYFIALSPSAGVVRRPVLGVDPAGPQQEVAQLAELGVGEREVRHLPAPLDAGGHRLHPGLERLGGGDGVVWGFFFITPHILCFDTMINIRVKSINFVIKSRDDDYDNDDDDNNNIFRSDYDYNDNDNNNKGEI